MRIRIINGTRHIIFIKIMSETIEVFFDGASRNNGSPNSKSGCGFFIKTNKFTVSGTKYLGLLFTNNEAEYNALIEALMCIGSLSRDSKVPKGTCIKIMGDSKLVIEQVSGRWKINAEGLKVLHKKCCEITEILRKKYNMKIEYIHVPRNLNKIADKLSNDAVDFERTETVEKAVENVKSENVYDF